ncbi:MAG: menaquinone-specific isochorismate synthase [Verrucomicrobiales bacterium]|jgi:menaquinone-specific isochorismate synthase
MDYVFLDIAPEMAVVGTGPFRYVSELPEECAAAFYVNDFSLSRDGCWAIPDQACTTASPMAESGVVVPSFAAYPAWEEPDRHEFSRVFSEIATQLADGRLHKAVPVVVERVTLNGRHPCNGSAPALHYDAARPGAAFRYGYQMGADGAFGVTPEALVTLANGKLHTMALAGTAPAASRDAFETDGKQIREHQFVVDALVDSLSSFGEVEIGTREIVEFARLLHFQTLLSVELPGAMPDPAEVVRALHPTPAVGVLPRTRENLDVLNRYRSEMAVPAMFGAPLGVWWQGTFHAVAAIRGFFWHNDQGSLPAGCGVISESIEEREWDELKLKRAWVKERIGLA